MRTKIKKVAQLDGHSGAIYCLAPYYGSRFFSAGFDNLIIEWNILEPGEAKAVAKLNSKAISLLYLKEKNWLAAGQSTGGVHIIDLQLKRELKLFQAHHDMIFALCYDSSEDMLYVGGADGKISAWSLSEMKMYAIQNVESGKIREIKLNGSFLYVGCGNGSIVILKKNNLSLVKKIEEHWSGYSVNSIAFDGKRMISGSRDGHLNILEMQDLNYSLTHRIPAHNYAIYKIEKSSDNQFFATASRDKSIKLWDAETFDFITKIDFKSFVGHVASVNDLICIENYLISTGDDRSIIIWELT